MQLVEGIVNMSVLHDLVLVTRQQSPCCGNIAYELLLKLSCVEIYFFDIIRECIDQLRDIRSYLVGPDDLRAILVLSRGAIKPGTGEWEWE